MDEQITINSNSSKEEVSDYFVKKFGINEEIRNNLINEDISGDILCDLDKDDLRRLGLKIGPLKKILIFIRDNKDKFEEKKIDKKITVKSTPDDVKNFFINCLNFKGDLHKLDGKGLIEISENQIINLGLNIGQRKKIIKYINYFKTLKEEMPEEKEIIITKKSTEEEVARVLKNKLNLSKEAIEILGLDGEALFLLEEDDIDDINELTEEEKFNLKNYLKELKEKNKENKNLEMEITINSSPEEIATFLKHKLNFSQNAINSLELDGNNFFLLKDNDFNNFDELTEEEKDNLKKYLEIIRIKFKAKDLLMCIIYFIEIFNKIKHIKMTTCINNFKSIYKLINSDHINENEIEKADNLLLKYNYDIRKESDLIQFYKLLYGREEALLFFKSVKDSNFDILNLNDLIDNEELETGDIEDLYNVNMFFDKLMDDQDIKTDEELLLNLQKNLENEKDIIIKLKEYLNIFEEIIDLYRLYNEYPKIIQERISQLLRESIINIYKEEKSDKFIYDIEYTIQNGKVRRSDMDDLENMKNSIIISKRNNNEDNNDERQFLEIIESIGQLINILNKLEKSGYPSLINLTFKINNSEVFEENIGRRNLKEIIDHYYEINNSFKRTMEIGYERYPLLRLFYGKQFKKLFKYALNKGANISHLVSSMTMNKVKNFDIDFIYNLEIDAIQNINIILDKLFKKNHIILDDIHKINKVKEDINLVPGLYRKIYDADNSELYNIILNIYHNLTGNFPLINTLLICNEETSKEKIKSFLYRAIFCNKPILFVITKIECLEFEILKYLVDTLKILYQKNNYKINSYILFIYTNIDSALLKDIESIIPNNNILRDSFLLPPQENIDELQKVEVYSSIFPGYGKTTEIRYKVKNLNGYYYYLPISGSTSRNYIINNLKDLRLDLNKEKTKYLHIDLSEVDNEDLMNEILFKLIILRYLDSKEKIFYLGNDIKIILEISNNFFNFEEKFKILTLFKKIYIDKLNPLRLEENMRYIKDSPISIVAEVLSLYDNGQIEIKNIDLEARIQKNSEECEKIINKYYNFKNQNYYHKINFIKILSVQFKKFTNNAYLNYKYAEYECNKQKIKIFRKTLVKNFIELAKFITCSPYDAIMRQKNYINLFKDYDENQLIEEEIYFSEKENQDIFNFKHNLVFFNRDGQSISIISNNNKNDPEYNTLKSLWNFQNFGANNSNDLIDYKTLDQENLLKQVKILFSLDTINIEKIKEIFINLGNYIFTPDNFIKMVIILLKLEAKIPVILMGETGVGKTKLLEILSFLYNKDNRRMRKLQIYPGRNNQKILEFIKEVENDIIEKGEEDELTWIFFDKINDCNSLGLLKEIICNQTYLGRKASDNFVFLGACNPYRIIPNKMRENSLFHHDRKEKRNVTNKLVYFVNPLPHSLFNFVFDFDSLEIEVEKNYIKNMIISLLNKIEKEKKITFFYKNDEVKLINEIIDSIIICHNFIREKYDKSSISLRDIRRFGVIYEYFIDYFKKYKSTYQKLKLSLNLALYICYYLRLNKKEFKQELSNLLNNFFNKNFLNIPNKEMELLTKEMSIEKGISLNKSLKENLFTSLICLETNIPLIIVGNPCTGKSIGFQILCNTLKGEYSKSNLFKEKGKIYKYNYLGSENNTVEGVSHIFEKALKLKTREKRKISLVYLEKINLAENSIYDPLKIIPYYLEGDRYHSISFIGISDWNLETSIMNNALNLSINDYDIEDLEEISLSIAKSLDEEQSNKYQYLLKTLAKTYNEYIIFNQNYFGENKDFHRNEDFYTLIKNVMSELLKNKKALLKNEDKILTETAILCLNRNFGGLEKSSSIIKKIFKKKYEYKFDESVDINMPYSIIDAIKNNILDSNSRNLLLISEGNTGCDIVKFILYLIGKKYVEIIGYKFKDLNVEIYGEKILNRIRNIMESNNILILRDLDIIYPSLYNLFNQNFTYFRGKRFVKIAFAYSNKSIEVNKDFHCIVIVNKNQIDNCKIFPTFLNKFEKHIIDLRTLLEEKDNDIARKLSEYLDKIISFSKDKNLKFDLEKTLIKSVQSNIEGLLFKIKNIMQNKNKDNKLDDKEYVKNIIKEIFKKIAPTFSRSVIPSLAHYNTNIDNEYKEINETFIEIYKESHYINFEKFFENINSKKNVIYTLSKITENIFANEKNIKNKFGLFNIGNTIIKYLQSINNENKLISILKSLINADNKKMLIIKFTENDLDKINSINYIIKDFQIDNPILNEKIIIFIIYLKRQSKKAKLKNFILDLIPFINFEIHQIFIDDLQENQA